MAKLHDDGEAFCEAAAEWDHDRDPDTGRCRECGHSVTGYDEAVPGGRDLTAQDVEDALSGPPETVFESAADYLNRIARGAPERGDDEPHGEQDTEDPVERLTAALSRRRLELKKALAQVHELKTAAGSLPAMPPEVTEALDYFSREIDVFAYPEVPQEARLHAAALSRWLLSLSNGHSDTGERAASEQDDPHPLYPHLPARPRGAVDAALDMLFRLASDGEADDVLRQARGELEHLIPFGLIPADPSPRSWSLSAPPPDDVTVVHLRGDGMRCERKGEYWVNPYGGELTWGEVLSDGFTVVEGEPQAAEPPRFERGFYRLTGSLWLGATSVGKSATVIVHGSVGDGVDLWVSVAYGNTAGQVPPAALAAAGAVRVDNDEETDR